MPRRIRALLLMTTLILAFLAVAPARATASAPGNDMFANATSVTIPSTHERDYDTASTEPDEPRSTCGGSRTQWFKLVVETEREISLAVSGVAWPSVTVYEGATLTALREIICFSYTRGPMLSFNAKPATTYFIQIGDEFGDDRVFRQSLRARFTTGNGMTFEDGQRWMRVDRNDDGRVEIRGGKRLYERDHALSLNEGRVYAADDDSGLDLQAEADALGPRAKVTCGSRSGVAWWGCGSGYASVTVSRNGVSATAFQCVTIPSPGMGYPTVCTGI